MNGPWWTVDVARKHSVYTPHSLVSLYMTHLLTVLLCLFYLIIFTFSILKYEEASLNTSSNMPYIATLSIEVVERGLNLSVLRGDDG